MTRYDPLYRWLGSKTDKRISLAFSKIEEILGISLPVSARSHREWWANEHDAHLYVQCRAWMDAGYETANVDLGNERVDFILSI
jgi:hypothetical protein